MTSAVSHLRRLAPRDLDRVVAIDAAITGRSRRLYFEKRLAAAVAEPGRHLQLAIDVDGRLGGYALGRALLGEFGSATPALRLEVIGVAPGEQGHGAGRELLAALADEAARQGLREVRTEAAWNDHRMLRFLDHAGFALGRTVVLDCAVEDFRRSEAARQAKAERSADLEPPSAEIDYGAGAHDFRQLARDLIEVRTLAPEDTAALLRIDCKLTGRDRSAYFESQVREALHDSAVRVSLTAHRDSAVVGFIMARTDHGDFGRTESVAVLDTIGVSPDFAHAGVATALLSQLFVNLEALRIERLETLVAREDFGLLGFLYRRGFDHSQRLAFVKRLGGDWVSRYSSPDGRL